MNPNQIIQNFRLVSRIGEGGMGEVWLAEDKKLKRQVALKCLHPQFVTNKQLSERLNREALILAKIQHSGIVTVYDYFELEGRGYLVMEYAEGVPMDQFVRLQGRPLTDAQLKDLFGQILDAFAYAHTKNIIHRDIKPANIFVTTDGKIKILDFGIGKVLYDGSPQLTKTGTQLGSLMYMSPEQLDSGRGLVDQRSDIYALGGLLFYMATGHTPYPENELEHRVAKNILSASYPDPCVFNPDISSWAKWAIMKATAKTPSNRFRSCQDFKSAMKGVPSKAERNLEETRIIPRQQENQPKVSNAGNSASAGSPAGTAFSYWKYWEVPSFGIFTLLTMAGVVAWTIYNAYQILIPQDATDLIMLLAEVIAKDQNGSADEIFSGLSQFLLVVNVLILAGAIASMLIARSLLNRGSWARFLSIVMLIVIGVLTIPCLIFSVILRFEETLSIDLTEYFVQLIWMLGAMLGFVLVGFYVLLSSRAGRYFRGEP